MAALQQSHTSSRGVATASARSPRAALRRGGGGAAARTRWRCRASQHMESEPALLSLPCFPLPGVLHPTQEGVLTAYEPAYRQLFAELAAERPGEAGRGARFVHLLSPSAAPPALLEGSVGGLPRVGCCAAVDSIEPQRDGSCVVRYSGHRRVSLLMLTQQEPYPVAAAEWYDDVPAGDLDPTVDVLERETASMLRQIAALSAAVDPAGGGGLPEALFKYAPPPERRASSYDALKQAGHRAASAIDTWRRHGSVYTPAPPAEPPRADPYQSVSESLGKSRRQELFSFAAAQLLEMGVAERVALALSQDTGARLSFVLIAMRPYLQQLAARASLRGAVG